MSEALDHLAARVAADPRFLAHPLAELTRSERLDAAGLAARLGCRADDLPRLRLCRAPRPTPAEFRADVAAVAARFGLDPGELAAAVRLGQGFARLRAAPGAAAGRPGVFLAARDADPPPPPPEEGRSP